MRILLLGFSAKKLPYVSRRLVQELKKRGHTVNYMFWGGLVFQFSKKGVVIKRPNGTDLKYYDYIIPRNPLFKGKEETTYVSHLYRHYLLLVRYINEHYKHVLNEKTIIKIPFYDKLLQHYLLAKNGLPIVTSLLYTGKHTPDTVYKKFKKPYIAKNVEGSKGAQVFLIEKTEQIENLVGVSGPGKVLIQKYIPTKHDYRVIVIGGKIIGAMKRTAKEGEFRANVSLGGTAEEADVTPEMQRLALKAAKIFNAEFAGVDIIKYKNKHYILEVNIFPGFEGFESATKINVAEKLISYIEEKYLWSIETEFDTKTKKKIFDTLYKIEKDNPEQTEKPFTKKDFLDTVLQRDLIVIYKNQEPIAFMTHYLSGKMRRITRMGILKDFRGQRMGRRMIRQLIEISKTAKNKKINVIVPANNKRRQLSFKKAGFIKKGKKKGYFINNIDGLVYEYKIQKSKKTRSAGLTKKSAEITKTYSNTKPK